MADRDKISGVDLLMQLEAENARLRAECERLRTIIDSRPAINAGLPETYIEWSRSIYLMDRVRALEEMQ